MGAVARIVHAKRLRKTVHCCFHELWHAVIRSRHGRRACAIMLARPRQIKVPFVAWANCCQRSVLLRSRVERKKSRGIETLLRLGLFEWGSLIKARNRWAGCSSLLVRRINKREVADFFKSWSISVAAGASLQSASYRVIQRGVLVRIKLSMKRWIRTWRVQAARRQLVVRFRGKSLWVFVAAAFDEWNSDTAKLRHSRLQYKRTLQSAKRMALRWNKFNLVVAMVRWQEQCLYMKRMVCAGAKIIFRWQRITLSSAIDRWHQQWQYKKRMRVSSSKILQRWKYVMLSRAMEHWQGQCQYMKRMTSSLRRAILRWQNKIVASAIEYWQGQYRYMKRMLSICRRILQRWQNNMFARAMEHWQGQHRNKKRIVIFCRKIAQQWQHTTLLAPALSRWSEHNHQSIHMRFVSSTIILRWQSMLVARALDAWHRHAQVKWEIQRVMRKADGARMRRGLRRCKALWQMYVDHQILLSWAARFGSRQTRRRILVRWRSWNTHARQAAWCAMWWGTHTRRRGLAAHFYEWLAVKQERLRMQMLKSSEGKNAELGACMQQLHSSIQDKQRLEDQLNAMQHHSAHLARVCSTLEEGMGVLGSELTKLVPRLQHSAQARLVDAAKALGDRWHKKAGMLKAYHQEHLQLLTQQGAQAREACAKALVASARLAEDERNVATKEVTQDTQKTRGDAIMPCVMLLMLLMLQHARDAAACTRCHAAFDAMPYDV